MDIKDQPNAHKLLFNKLRDSGIGVNLHYIPIYRQPFYEKMGFKAGYCPEAESYHRDALSIPMYPTLSTEEQDRVIDTLKKVII